MLVASITILSDNFHKMSDPLKRAAEMANKILISSIFSTLLWILPYAMGALVIVSFSHNFLVEIFFIVIISSIIIVILGTFVCILIFGNEDDKNRLRNEEYAFNVKVIGMLGSAEHLIEYFKAINPDGGINNPKSPDPNQTKKLPPPEGDIQ